MVTKKLMAVFIMTMFILPGTIAYAHGKNKDAAAFFFLKKVAINLPEAIEGVEKVENGKVIFFKIEEEEKDEAIQYEMKILKDTKVFEAIVDPQSGKVLQIKPEGFFSYFSDDLKETSPNTKFSLINAISIVEKHYGGKVLKGAFQGNSSIKVFRIRVANNEGAFTVMVDANTGELFRVGNDGNHHDEECDE
jgi:uncharacterized membrane protein YkoI